MLTKNNISKSLAPLEIDLLSYLEFKNQEIYTREELFDFIKDNKKTAYLIKKLLEKKRLLSLFKNTYLLVPVKAPQGLWSGNEYIIAKKLARDSKYYIGFTSVFNSYGFTEQVSQMVYIVNNKYSGVKVIQGIKYKLMKVTSKKMFGLEERIIHNEAVVFSSKERAMIDIFEFYKKNIKQAYAILRNQLASLNIKTFIRNVVEYPTQITRRRIGYFLEQLKIEKKLLDTIDVGKKGYSSLYGKISLSGKINQRWRVIVNE